MQRTSRQILVGARRLAPRGSHTSGSGKRKTGAQLRESLRANVTVNTTTVRARIGSGRNYAATVHQGSKPHIIVSKRGKKLKFQWDRGNALLRARRRGSRQFFYFDRVHHPGNKRPVRYLTTPLTLFGRANGFRISTVGGVNRTRLP